MRHKEGGKVNDSTHRFVDKQADMLLRRINGFYAKAAKGAQAKVKAFIADFEAEDAQKRRELPEREYKRWRRKKFSGEGWETVLAYIVSAFVSADRQSKAAMRTVCEGLFIEVAHRTAKGIRSMAGIVLPLITKDAAAKEIGEYPFIFEKKFSKLKDTAWNKRRAENILAAGITLGVGAAELVKMLSTDLAAKNSRAMRGTVNTAVTSAAAAAIVYELAKAKERGGKSYKVWETVGDDRVREAHQELDGDEKEVGQPFEVDGAEIMFPGDPDAPLDLTYNCRCWLVYYVSKR